MRTPPANVLELREVSRSDAAGASVRKVSASFAAGRLHVLRGAETSDCGLLLRLAGLLEVPDSGEVFLEGQPTRALTEEARAALRSQRCGYVFASPFLLGSFSVIENVAMPLFKIRHVEPAEARERTDAMLDFVEMHESREARIEELPLAAQCRVALARGLVNQPALLFVEDFAAAFAPAELPSFAALLRRACAEFGTAVIVAGSGAFPVEARDRVLDIADGAIRAGTGILSETPT